jgi:hypothetical protein
MIVLLNQFYVLLFQTVKSFENEDIFVGGESLARRWQVSRPSHYS